MVSELRFNQKSHWICHFGSGFGVRVRWDGSLIGLVLRGTRRERVTDGQELWELFFFF